MGLVYPVSFKQIWWSYSKILPVLCGYISSAAQVSLFKVFQDYQMYLLF